MSSSLSSVSEEEEESKVEPVVSKVDIDTTFGADLEPDECEVVEGDDFIEVQTESDFGEEVSTQIAATGSLHYFGCHFSDKWYGQGYLAEMVLSAVTGRNDDEDNNGSNFVVDGGPDVDEDKLTEETTLFEKTFILKHRSLFSEKLSPDS